MQKNLNDSKTHPTPGEFEFTQGQNGAEGIPCTATFHSVFEKDPKVAPFIVDQLRALREFWVGFPFSPVGFLPVPGARGEEKTTYFLPNFPPNPQNCPTFRPTSRRGRHDKKKLWIE